MARARELRFGDLTRRIRMQAQSAFRQHRGHHFRIAQDGRQLAREPADRVHAVGRIAQPRFGTHILDHPAFDHGAGRFPDVELQIEAAELAVARIPEVYAQGFTKEQADRFIAELGGLTCALTAIVPVVRVWRMNVGSGLKDGGPAAGESRGAFF